MNTKNQTLTALLTLGILLAFGPSAYGQERKPEKPDSKPGTRQGGRGGGVQAQLDRLTEDLKLNDEQKPKVKEVLEESGKKQRELRDQNPSPEERREKLQAIRKEMSGKLEKVLTKDQFAKYQESQRQGQRRQGQGQEKGQRRQRRQQ